MTETERQYQEMEQLVKQVREDGKRGELGTVAGFRLYGVERNGGFPKVLAYYTYQDHQALETRGKLGDLVRTRTAFLPLSRVDRLVDYLEVSGALSGVMVLYDKGAKPRLLEASTEQKRDAYPWV